MGIIPRERLFSKKMGTWLFMAAGTLFPLFVLGRWTWLCLLGAPLMWGLMKLGERQRESRENQERLLLFPDFLDLLGVALSAGMNLTPAWKRAMAFLPASRLKKDLAQGLIHLELGKPAEDVFQDLKKKWRDPRFLSALSLLQNGLRMGFSLREIILEISDSVRKELMIELEKMAETAKVKILFPIVFFIFPALFILLFGSLALSFFQTNPFQW